MCSLREPEQGAKPSWTRARAPVGGSDREQVEQDAGHGDHDRTEDEGEQDSQAEHEREHVRRRVADRADVVDALRRLAADVDGRAVSANNDGTCASAGSHRGARLSPSASPRIGTVRTAAFEVVDRSIEPVPKRGSPASRAFSDPSARRLAGARVVRDDHPDRFVASGTPRTTDPARRKRSASEATPRPDVHPTPRPTRHTRPPDD